MSDFLLALQKTTLIEQIEVFAASIGFTPEQAITKMCEERAWEKKSEQKRTTLDACIRILIESGKIAGILLSDAQAEELLSEQPIPVTTGQLYEIMPTLLVEAASKFPDSVIL